MTPALPPDQLTKYIRITGERHAKFIEFDFAIHDPTLFVELVLPRRGFSALLRHQSGGGNDRGTAAWNDAQKTNGAMALNRPCSAQPVNI